ncbi:Cytochrome c-552 [uncultured bacterium]|nr:Cytochrome c-552 [uncultured bacterium]
MRVYLKLFLPILFALPFLGPVEGAAGEADWSKIAQKEVTLFYPGVASWEFLNGDDHRLGGREIKKGKKDCRHCHMSKEGELDLKAAEIASGSMKMKRSHSPFEPEPKAGKKGTMKARVQAAYDAENVYLRVEWESKGSGWRTKGEPDRVSVQMNRAEPSFARYGCFITCHNDLNSMPESPSRREVAANPAYGGREDVRLYAFYAKNSWDSPRHGDRMKTGLIDLKSIEFENGKSVARDGWVFDDRAWEEKESSGTGTWTHDRYSAVFKFKLKSADKFDVAVSEGDIIPVAISIHDEGASRRKHYVSFPLAIGLGAAAEVRASKLSN